MPISPLTRVGLEEGSIHDLVARAWVARLGGLSAPITASYLTPTDTLTVLAYTFIEVSQLGHMRCCECCATVLLRHVYKQSAAGGCHEG